MAAQLPKAGDTHGVALSQPRLDIMWARLAVVALDTARRDVGVATGEGAAAPLVDLAHPAACFGAGVMAFLEERGTAPRHVGMAARHDMLGLWRAVQHAKTVAAAMSGRAGDGGAAAADARAQDALNRGHAWFGDADLATVQQWYVPVAWFLTSPALLAAALVSHACPAVRSHCLPDSFEQAGGRALPELLVVRLLSLDVESAAQLAETHVAALFPCAAAAIELGDMPVAAWQGRTIRDAPPRGDAQGGFKPPPLHAYSVPWAHDLLSLSRTRDSGAARDGGARDSSDVDPGTDEARPPQAWRADAGSGSGGGEAVDAMQAVPADVQVAAALLASIAAAHLERPSAPVLVPHPFAARRAAAALRTGARLPRAAAGGEVAVRANDSAWVGST